MEKKCKSCGLFLPVDQFQIFKKRLEITGKITFYPSCRQCESKRRKIAKKKLAKIQGAK